MQMMMTESNSQDLINSAIEYTIPVTCVKSVNVQITRNECSCAIGIKVVLVHACDVARVTGHNVTGVMKVHNTLNAVDSRQYLSKIGTVVSDIALGSIDVHCILKGCTNCCELGNDSDLHSNH